MGEAGGGLRQGLLGAAQLARRPPRLADLRPGASLEVVDDRRRVHAVVQPLGGGEGERREVANLRAGDGGVCGAGAIAVARARRSSQRPKV